MDRQKNLAAGAADAPSMPTIPKDSPFAVTASSAEPPVQSSGVDSTSVPFSFSFSLGATSSSSKSSVATYDLAAPISASESASALADASSKSTEPPSRKIGRARRGRQRVADEEETIQDEAEEDYDDGEDTAYTQPQQQHTFTTQASAALPFDSDKFDLSSFAFALPGSSKKSPEAEPPAAAAVAPSCGST
jgi:hypothetical protein